MSIFSSKFNMLIVVLYIDAFSSNSPCKCIYFNIFVEIFKFAFSHQYFIFSPSPLPREQIVQNALSNRGKYDYSILSNNCEHFASRCRYGKSKSEQAKKAKIGIGSGTVGLILAAIIGIVVAVVKVFLKL